MDYTQACKLADSAPKSKDNYLVIRISYDFKLVLPYKAGLAFLESLSNGEQLYHEYSEQHRICAIEPGKLTVNLMSQKEYREYKIAALMGIKIEEVQEHHLIKETV